MSIKIIECPRDAMQGLQEFVPTEVKITYLNQLLRVGYHTLDCGSFVSAKAIPQMRDSSEVLAGLDLENTSTKLSVIVANKQGIDTAVLEPRVNFLGYPFSVSEEFQQRNTNKSIIQSLDVIDYLQSESKTNAKDVVVYISMGFGNPYGETWNVDIVERWVAELAERGITHFSISDTVGVGTAKKIEAVFNRLNKAYSSLDFGAHFHTRPDEWIEKVDAAWSNGCERFDGAIKGFGGCPMANDKLVGNMPTENLVTYFSEKGIDCGINTEAFDLAKEQANQIFE